MVRHQPRPRVRPLQLPMTRSTRAAEARADRHRRPSGSPPGAHPAAISISGSRHVRSAAGRTAATTWHAVSCIRASARCCPRNGRTRGASSRAQIGAAAHHGRRRGRSRRLSASASRGTPDAPRHTPLRPHGELRAASARRAVAASATPRLRREQPRGNRRRCPPQPPQRAIRGSIRI